MVHNGGLNFRFDRRADLFCVDVPPEGSSSFDLACVGAGPAFVWMLNSIDRASEFPPCKIVSFDPSLNPDGGSPHQSAIPDLRVNMLVEKHNFPGQPPFADYLKQVGANDVPPTRYDLGRYTGQVRSNVVRSLEAKGFKVVRFRQAAIEMFKLPQHGYELTLSSGQRVMAGRVVLGMGHNPPSFPIGVVREDGSSSRVSYYNGSDSFCSSIKLDDRVLVIGSSLGGGDVARILRQHLTSNTPVVLGSRSGSLPQVQCADEPSLEIRREVEELVSELLTGPKLSLSHLMHRFMPLLLKHVSNFEYAKVATAERDALLDLVRSLSEARKSPLDRLIFQAICDHAPKLWNCIDEAGQIEFHDRYLRVYMNYRNAFPEATARWLSARLAEGAIRVIQLTGPVTVARCGVVATVRNELGSSETINFDRLVIATGPEYKLSLSQNPLVRQLLDSGLAKLGLINGREIGGFKTRNLEVEGLPGVFAIGALTYAEDFSVTGYNRLRAQSETIIRKLIETQLGSVGYRQHDAVA